MGRSNADLYEVGLWEDLVTVRGGELFNTYIVDNQAIVLPKTLDAIRALSGREADGKAFIVRTDAAFGIGQLASESARPGRQE